MVVRRTFAEIGKKLLNDELHIHGICHAEQQVQLDMQCIALHHITVCVLWVGMKTCECTVAGVNQAGRGYLRKFIKGARRYKCWHTLYSVRDASRLHKTQFRIPFSTYPLLRRLVMAAWREGKRLTVFLLSVSSGSSKQSMTAIWWSLAYWGKSLTIAASPFMPMYFKLWESLLMNLTARIDR